ncbi:hypothetical protein BDD12DRAFT_908785, partial [Trichophaea hybrida]
RVPPSLHDLRVSLFQPHLLFLLLHHHHPKQPQPQLQLQSQLLQHNHNHTHSFRLFANHGNPALQLLPPLTLLTILPKTQTLLLLLHLLLSHTLRHLRSNPKTHTRTSKRGTRPPVYTSEAILCRKSHSSCAQTATGFYVTFSTLNDGAGTAGIKV